MKSIAMFAKSTLQNDGRRPAARRQIDDSAPPGWKSLWQRKIIGSAVAVIIAVALAIAFLPAKGEAAIQVIDVLASDPGRVVFTITNTSRTTLAWYMHLQVMKEGSFPTPRSPEAAQHNELNGLAASGYDLPVPTDQRWRIAVWYDRPTSEQFFLRWRGELARFAFDRAWYRFGNWIQPDPIMLWAYGPEMLGNKPAPSAASPVTWK